MTLAQRPREQKLRSDPARLPRTTPSRFPGRAFALNAKPFGATDRTGALSVFLRGSEGQTVRLSLACPEGYSPPEALPALRLARTRRLGHGGIQPLTLESVCTRRARAVALIVHALPGKSLPVEVDGKAVSSTDADGNAHLLLEVDRSRRMVTTRLDTIGEPSLLPHEPAAHLRAQWARRRAALCSRVARCSPQSATQAELRARAATSLIGSTENGRICARSASSWLGVASAWSGSPRRGEESSSSASKNSIYPAHVDRGSRRVLSSVKCSGVFGRRRDCRIWQTRGWAGVATVRWALGVERVRGHRKRTEGVPVHEQIERPLRRTGEPSNVQERDEVIRG